MNAGVRSCVAVVTVVSVACSGRACGRASEGPAATVSAGRTGEGPAGVGSAEHWRASLLNAQRGLASALGRSIDPKRVTVADVTRMVEELLTAAATTERTLNRETFDAQVVARRVGPAPEALMAWVRDQTTLVPYRGVLRGAPGVLMDRVGNSLDRALLLTELLRTTGTPVRLAHGQLSQAQAHALVEQSRTQPLRRSTSSPSAATEAVATLARTRNVDEARLRQAVADMTAAAQSVSQGVQQRVDRQATELTTTVAAPTTLAATAAAADVEALRDHWWVQVQRGGQWEDLDPTAGRPAIRAAEVLEPKDLPSSLYHAVVMRVVIERWSAGRLEEATALEEPLRPVDVLGQRVALRHAPLNWPHALTLESDAAQVTAALQAQKEWLPVLTVGARRLARASVTESGRLNTTPTLGGKGLPAAPQRSVSDMAGALGGDEPPAAEPAGHLTAEWIEYEIRRPGQAPERIRRTVFDLVGPAARTGGAVSEPDLAGSPMLARAMALAGDTESLLLGTHLSPEFATHVTNSALLSQSDTLRELLRAGAAGTLPTEAVLEKLTTVSGELYGLALARVALSPVKDQIFLDRPNIFSFHRQLQPRDPDQVVVSKSLDIVANQVAVRPAVNADLFRVRVAQGVTDTAAEALALGSGCGGCGPVANVSELRVATDTTAWIGLQRLTDTAWDQIALDADTRRRVEDDVRAGYVVLIPPHSISVAGRESIGWWRLDPRSGHTLGIMQSGQGQAMKEYILGAAAVVLSAGIGVLAARGCLGTPSSAATASSTKRNACITCGVLTGLTTLVATAVTFMTVGLGASAASWLASITMGTLCSLASWLME